MFNLNKVLLGIFAFLIVLLIVETGYFYYLKYTPSGFTSLSSVTYRKDYEAWLQRNSAITRSRQVTPDAKTNLIINQTEGVLENFTRSKKKISATIKTPKGVVAYVFVPKDFKLFLKPANTKEVLVPLEEKALLKGDSVVIHESFMVSGDRIQNTNNGIVKLEKAY